MSCRDTPGATHHAGCDCWEARHREELAGLRAQLEATEGALGSAQSAIEALEQQRDAATAEGADLRARLASAAERYSRAVANTDAVRARLVAELAEAPSIPEQLTPSVLARITGHVRSVCEGRARLHLDEQPTVWDGAVEGQEIEVVVMARGRR